MNAAFPPFTMYGYVGAFGVVFFVLFVFYAVLFIISRMSGWQQLVEKYPDQGVGMPASKRYFVYGGMKKYVNYNGSLVLESTATGLRVRMAKLFSLGHPAFFIPWSDLTVVDAKRGITFTKGLQLARMDGVAMYVTPGVGEWIATEKGKYSV